GVAPEWPTRRVWRIQIPHATRVGAARDRVRRDSRSAAARYEAVRLPSASRLRLSYARFFRPHVSRPADLRAETKAPGVRDRARAHGSLHCAAPAPALRPFGSIRAARASAIADPQPAVCRR